MNMMPKKLKKKITFSVIINLPKLTQDEIEHLNITTNIF